MLQCFRENVLVLFPFQVQIFTVQDKFCCPCDFLRYTIFYSQKKNKLFISKCMQKAQSASASTDVEIVKHPKNPLILDKNHVSHRKKKIIFIAKILPSGTFQINFFVFCLKEKLFHWNRFDIRKHKECDFISLLGKDAVTEDIYTWIRLSAQQGISFDPTMKLNALFITAEVFFCGKYNEVANPSSGLEQERGWRGNNSGLDSTVSQEENSWSMSALKMGFLGNDALQLVTSPCIIAGSFPASLPCCSHWTFPVLWCPCLWALRVLQESQELPHSASE